MQPNRRPVLVYKHNPQTDLPQLEDTTGRLSRAELGVWEAELNRRFSAQALRGGDLITFAPLRDLPTRYRVGESPGPTNRFPTYVLEALPDAPELPCGPLPARAPAWPEGFLTEAAELIAASHADRTGRHGLGFVLEELGELADRQPRELALALLGAYAAAGHLACRAAGDGDRRGQFYALALEALNPQLLRTLEEAETADRGPLGQLVDFFTRRLGLQRLPG